MDTDEEIACFKCGSNEFRLTRTTRGQILAECSKCGYPHLMEGVSIFWNPEEEGGTTEEKTSEVIEVQEQKISKEIEEKSVEELANEMIEFIKKESLDNAPFYEISRIFWNKKGLDFMFTVEPDIALKRLKVERTVKERLPFFLGEISPIDRSIKMSWMNDFVETRDEIEHYLGNPRWYTVTGGGKFGFTIKGSRSRDTPFSGINKVESMTDFMEKVLSNLSEVILYISIQFPS